MTHVRQIWTEEGKVRMTLDGVEVDYHDADETDLAPEVVDHDVLALEDPDRPNNPMI